VTTAIAQRSVACRVAFARASSRLRIRDAAHDTAIDSVMAIVERMRVI
jgi:hypothetical protein